ncbi:MAG: putative alkaline phosphatase [Frankiales bacterium]|nr:putative alkaline phosphatase [Frankiales bacterium]
MSVVLSRRSLLLAGAAGAAAALLPWDGAVEAAVTEAAASVFGFGIASGDPTATAVVLWTRVTPTPDALPGSGRGKPVAVTWEVAADEAFRSVIRRGTTSTSAARDHTVQVDVTGLTPYTRYWYRFTALGKHSPVGRTQTSPDEPGVLHALRLGIVSCANWTGGFFAPYRHLALRDDLDAVLCLGDYLYEYGNDEDRYGPSELVGRREHEPSGEMVALRDYRRRHALYKTDPDLAAAHRRHPWVFAFDDHEVCDNAWAGGGVNHQPEDGPFATRKRLAYQAYLEWVPLRLPPQAGAVGTRFWRRFSFGDLADLSVLETRQNRSLQSGAAADVEDPNRHLPEPAQLNWLTDGIGRSRKPWHLVGNQVVVAQVRIPATPSVLAAVTAMLPGVSSPLPAEGYVFNSDQWDGYAVDQRRLLTTMSGGKTDTVVLTGDIHSSWANDLPLDPGSYVPGVTGESSGVEFVCPSVSSDGFYEVAQRQQAGALALTTAVQTANRHVRFLEGVHHGFLVVDVTPDRVQTDYVWTSSTVTPSDPRLDPAATASVGASWLTIRGTRVVAAAAGPVGPRADQPRAARVAAARTVPRAPLRPAAPSGNLAATGGNSAAAAVGLGVLGAAAVAARRATTD